MEWVTKYTEVHPDAVMVTARALAAAGTFTAKETYKYAIGGVHIKSGAVTTLTATDSYKLVQVTSRRASGHTNPNDEFVLDWQGLKATKMLTPRPKASMWVAIHRSPANNDLNLVFLEEKGEGQYTERGRATVKALDANFPSVEPLFKGKAEYAKGEQSNAGPYLNTSYLIDLFKAIELAVSADGAAATSFIHGPNWNQPMFFEAENKSGEAVTAICMPIRH